MNKNIPIALVSSWIFLFFLSLTSVGLAQYNPPADDRPPPKEKTQSAGSRGGCDLKGEIPLTLLAPQSHVGQTASTHPSFAWFIPDSQSFPLTLTIYEYDESLDLPTPIFKVNLKSSPGIMKFSMPKEQPGLKVGRRYIWQVAIICNPNRPSRDLVANAEIDVVEIDASSGSSLWYDRLTAALESSGNGKLSSEASALLADLAEIENAINTNPENSAGDRLRKIVEYNGAID